MKNSHSRYLDVRGLRYHVRSWGDPKAPKLVLLHGWMDVSASFQFLVDALRQEWCVLAPDWRGFGLTQWDPSGYWFADYLADLDFLLRELSPDAPVNVAGHSMGGNALGLYAGARPERVNRIALLEGFGLPRTTPDKAPRRYAQWMDDLVKPPSLKSYASLDEVVERLKKNNPKLSDERARFLAPHWARPIAEGGSKFPADGGEKSAAGKPQSAAVGEGYSATAAERHSPAAGGWELAADPRHKMVHPVLYRLEEAIACWKLITAPTLWVWGDGQWMRDWFKAGKDNEENELNERRAAIAHLEEVRIPEAGHMLHFDAPERLAEILETFFMRKA